MVNTSVETIRTIIDWGDVDYEHNKFEHRFTEQFGFRPPVLLMMHSAIAVLGLLGVVGNVLSMVIWTRPQVKSSSSVLLTALAACDILILVAENTPYYLYVLWLNFYDSPAMANVHKFIYPQVRVWFYPVYRTAQTASIYLTLGITLERYIAVCHPFEAQLVCTYSKAYKYAAAIITVSILYNLVEFLDEKVVAHHNDNGDIAMYVIRDTELSRSPLYQSIYGLYSTWLRLILTSLLPLICITVLNTLIYLEMKRMKKRVQAITNSQRNENRLTMMLVYVVAEFLVCSLCNVLYTIIIGIFAISDAQLGLNPVKFYPLYMFFDTFNSSSNVLTYVVFGAGFREAFLSTFSCCRGLCRLRSSNRTVYRELDVRAPEILNCNSGNQTADLEF